MTYLIFGGIAVVSFIVFLIWALGRMAALGDRDDL